MGAVWGFTGRPDVRLAERMSATLTHRGGPRTQQHSTPTASILLREPHRSGCLGLVPPALHDFPEVDLTIALCGWINGIDDPELATAAESSSNEARHFYAALARQFRSQGPTLFESLRGAFVLVVRDGATLHLTRDGAGNRTVFYGRCDNRWLFGIEPKAITVVPEFTKRVRPAALAQYLACSFVPGRGTMLEDLFELQAGSTVSLRSGEPPQVTRWFRFEDGEPAADSSECSSAECDASRIQRFRTELERAVAERIPRGEPVGVFLSGGLDSSVVTAELARQIGGNNVRTWAIHFGKKYQHELDFARAVAERCGTVHEEVHIQPRHFLPRLRQMVWHLDR